MYGLPPHTDLEFLAELELIQVCVGSNQVILRFENDTTILLECEYSLDDRRSNASDLLPLVGTRLSGATQGQHGEIVLTFSGGHALVFRDSNSNYESYQITAPARHIIV
jgi:hypothetical protein